jgi:oligopeptide/dipeptide ABC transporter ATP-binding protein
MSEAPILGVRDLSVVFRTDSGWLTAIEGVGFDLYAREALGIVGESGSGKSVTALSILRLHAQRTTRIPGGSIHYDGRDLLALPERDMRAVRGGEIAMIFQDPMSSLNPVLTIADQIGETMRLHQGLGRAAARKRAVALLDMVRIADAARVVEAYPHQLSGGMRQRVMIAIAIACRPRLLIADEPTTALDVTIQAQILDLLRDLQAELGMAVILITHDLGIVAEFARRVLVMYAGRVVEQAPVHNLFRRPMHPYTAGLIAAIPPLDTDTSRLPTIPGSIPDPGRRIPGCRFSPRCNEVEPMCRQSAPELVRVGPDHLARCPPRLTRLGAGP